MAGQNESNSIQLDHLDDHMMDVNSHSINDAMFFLKNKSKRYRREDYNEDDYEIVCKHSNTGWCMHLFS